MEDNKEYQFNIAGWINSAPAADYDFADGAQKEVGDGLTELLRPVIAYCEQHAIPFSAIFSAGSRNEGKDSRYTSVTYLAPVSRVCPEVLIGALLTSLGASGFIDHHEYICGVLQARADHLMKDEE